nr:unnamed protein product [Digitaria exilis]
METALFSAASLFRGADDSDNGSGDERAYIYCCSLVSLIMLSATGALAIFLRKSFGVNITTSDYDDKEIEENIAYNCRANDLDVLPHIRHTWGDPFPVSRPDWDIVIASDILLYVKQYDNLVKTVSFLLKEYKKTSEKAGCTTITDKSGSY